MTGIDFTVFRGSLTGKIVESKTHKESLKPDEVLLKITHAGLCGTDEHYKTSDMVLGHEGVGVVQQVGSQVTSFKLTNLNSGDRAGWGFLHNSCGHCDECLNANEFFCPDRSTYGKANTDQGAFATHAVWKAAFLFHIPDAVSSSDAAPLMCAGATVFNAMYLYNVRPADRVGIIGVGGLGHIAIQFAAKMGCEVVVFSGSDRKREEAKSLGAKEFYTRNVSKQDVGKPIKHLFVTTSHLPDWDPFLSILAPNATIYPITVSHGNFVMPYTPIISKGLRIQGIFCASRGVHAKMLRFVAVHGIKPITQEFPLTAEGIEEAMAKLEKGEIRYRAVLVAGR
ncbi:chaperonin 10-like protein [Suillus bovinus]|uniref:chaperonin 10-like protein n=1 Tax=Suillus bovinus TaxID=48563 RepID=UPI001B874726|nr:chaperonin 10-like protein [Suillus bovinus]KAG2149143.1 chaperonin 10-like protein [Suillus bovinus]